MTRYDASNRGLTICMFSNLFPPVVSGSSTQVAALSRELVARGCSVIVITAKTSPAAPDVEDVRGVRVYRLPAIRLPRMRISLYFPWLNWTFLPSNVRRIRAILDEHRPNVLHLHNHMFDLGFSAVLMRRRFGVPLVVTIHTMIKHAKAVFNAILYPLDRLFLRHTVINRCDAVIAPDVNILRYAESAWGRRDCEVVPYGISLGRVTPESVAALKERYGLEGKRVILSLGHIHENRNRRDLVQAFAVVLENVPNAVLLLVGTEATPVPRDLARSLGIAESVLFAGHLPHDEVQALLSLCDVEAHWATQDSPENTSLGIASLEAMAAGKPVFAAANPDTYGVGVLQDNRNFIVAHPGNPRHLAKAMIEVLRDDARREEIGRLARRTVEDNFVWDIVCRRTISIYERLARGSSLTWSGSISTVEAASSDGVVGTGNLVT